MNTGSLAQTRRLFTVQNGGTPKTSVSEYWGGDVPWVTPEDLGKNDERLIGSSRRTLTQRGIAACNAEIVPAGSIVLSTRAPIGYSAIAGVPLATNQGCKSLVPLRDLDSRFFEYQLSTRIRDLQIRGSGSTFMELSTDALASFQLDVPPLATQHKIADFLDRETERIDALVDKKRRLIDLLEEKRTATITHLTSGTTAPLVHLGRFVDLTPGFAFSSSGFLTDGVRLLRGANIAPGSIRWLDTKYWADDDSSINDTHSLAIGDIVLGMDRPWIGSGMRVAKVGPSDVPSLLVQRVARLRSRVGLHQDFLYATLRSLAFKAYFDPILTGISVPHISGEQILDYRCAVPSLDEQRSIAQHIERVDGALSVIAELLATQLSLLAEFREALITAAVTGEIDVDTFDSDQQLEETPA